MVRLGWVYGLVTLEIFVPVVFVTPDVVDQYMLYDVAPETASQLMVTWASPAVAVTPVGADGGVVENQKYCHMRIETLKTKCLILLAR